MSWNSPSVHGREKVTGMQIGHVAGVLRIERIDDDIERKKLA
jgi:hypothetical protein